MSSTKNLELEKTSFLSKSNNAFIEQMYLKFINKDSDLPESWQDYFKRLNEDINTVAKEINGPSWSLKKKIDIDEIEKRIDEEDKKKSQENNTVTIESKSLIKNNANSIRAVALIRAYRQRGHLLAKLDPLGMMKTEYLDELHPDYYGFKKEDYNTKIYLDGVTNKEHSTVKEILSFLKKTYCGPVGYEYMHISNPTERKWLRDRIEND